MSAGHRLIDEITKPGRPQVQQVSDSVYAYIQPDGTWWINNTGFLVGPQGVISIDTCSTERRTRAYRQAIADVTTAPVRTVVNTHHHGDHTFGNCLFPQATIVGHELAREEAIAFGPPRALPFWDHGDWGDLTLAPPSSPSPTASLCTPVTCASSCATWAPQRTRRTTCWPA